MRKSNKSEQGSMTVEAVITLPVFLMFFMFMMYMVNVCNAYLALNHAVDQVTKYTANNVYITAKVNQKLDSGGNWAEFNEAKDSVLSDSIEEAIREGDPEAGLNKIKDFVKSYFAAQFKDFVSGMVSDAMDSYFENTADQLLLDLIDGSKIDKNRVELTLYKIPSGELTGKNAERYDGKFGTEDIVVQAQYNMLIDLPLMNEFEFPIVSTCVEKGFTKGGREEYVTLKDASFIQKFI